MRVLISGGKKTINLVSAMRKNFNSGTVEITSEDNIKDIRNFISRGDLFDRAIIMQQSITEDESITDESTIREIIANFIEIISSKFRRYEVVFVVLDEDMAKMVCEEAFSVIDRVKVIIQKPRYNVGFFKGIILNDINNFPDNINVYEYDDVDLVEDSGNAVGFSFEDTDFDDTTEIESTTSNEVDIDNESEVEEEDELKEASFDDEEEEEDFKFDFEDDTEQEDFEFGSIEDAFGSEDGEDFNADEIEENNEFGLFDEEVTDGFGDSTEGFELDETIGFEDNTEEFGLQETNEFGDSDSIDDFDSDETTGFEEEFGDTTEKFSLDEAEEFDNNTDENNLDNVSNFEESFETSDFEDNTNEFSLENNSEEGFDFNEADFENEESFEDSEIENNYEEDTIENSGDSAEDELFNNEEINNLFNDEEDNIEQEEDNSFILQDNDFSLEADEAIENTFEMNNNSEELESLFESETFENEDEALTENTDTFNDTSDVDSIEDLELENSFTGLNNENIEAEEFIDNTFEMNNEVSNNFGVYSSEKSTDTVEKKKVKKIPEKLEESQTMSTEDSIDAESLFENIDETETKDNSSISNNNLTDAGKQFKGLKGKSNIKPNINKRKSILKDNNKDLMGVLNTVMNSSKHRGNIILVTGSRDSGKTIVASNLANLINKLGYTVLVVDMDTKNRGLSYITKDIYETVHLEDPSNASLRAGVNTANSDMTKYANIIKPGYHLLTMGLASDLDDVSDVINTKKLNSFMSSAKSIYNYIIIDAQFEDTVTTLKDVCETADNIVITAVPTNHGMMELLLNMTNIEDVDIQESMYTRGQLLFSKVINVKTLFGSKVKSIRDMLEVLDKTFLDLAGYTPELSFADMRIIGLLNYSESYENFVFNSKQITDTKDGEQIFIELLHNILVNKEME